MKCSKRIKSLSGHLHAFSILIIAVFSIIQVYLLETKHDTRFWIPIGLVIMILLHLPNIICIALKDWHGWYTFIASIITLLLNAYLIYYLVKIKHYHYK
jgi:CHASE2 domain-containing sensor protein